MIIFWVCCVKNILIKFNLLLFVNVVIRKFKSMLTACIIFLLGSTVQDQIFLKWVTLDDSLPYKRKHLFFSSGKVLSF